MATAAATMDFGHIVHATDFSAAGEPAFNHALRLALAARSHLYVVHAEHLEPGDDADWDAFPGVRSTLARWGLLAADAEPAAVHAQLGVRVTKADVPDSDPVDGVLRFITHNQCDFLVVGTRAREDLATRVRGSVAETLARRSQIPTLFLPIGNPGFVDHATGAPRLRNVLLPVDFSVPPAFAASLALRIADALGCEDAVLHALHVGSLADAPVISADPRHQGRVRHIDADGSVVESIVAQAAAIDADLIVMATRGHDGVLDHLRGSTTEQVLHRAHRPLLAVSAA
jgi:nucleotide-binding universal stress UspA family protein